MTKGDPFDAARVSYMLGQRDAINDARKAVSDIADRWDHWIGQCLMSKAIDGQYIDREDALAAIDALGKEPND